MAESSGPGPGLVRVTVASGTRRVDLVLPGAVPVAELVPELARSVGLLDPATAHGGYRLVSGDGRELAAEGGLTLQGVEDGGLLTVSAVVDEEVPRVYDDIVEAMADVVERDLRPWQPASGRRTALGAAGLLLALGAAALLLQPGTMLPAVAAAVVALLLCAGAVVLSRAQGEPEAATALAWLGSGYGAVAGLLLAPAAAPIGSLAGYAGNGALLAGVLTLVGLADGRALVIPCVVVGAVGVAGSLVTRHADVDPLVVLVSMLVVVVVVGSVLPWLAMGLTGIRVEQVHDVADLARDPAPVDRTAVGADARAAHEILVAVSATVGLLLVLVAPAAVGLGVFGTVLAVACCAVVLLRTRQYRTGTTVLVGLASGILGLVSTALAVLWLHRDWGPGAAVVLATTGALLMAATLLPATSSVRRGRLGDLAETAALVSLLPALLLAAGVHPMIGS